MTLARIHQIAVRAVNAAYRPHYLEHPELRLRMYDDALREIVQLAEARGREEEPCLSSTCRQE